MAGFSAICNRLSQYLKEQQSLASVAQPSLLSELDVSAETEAGKGGVASDRQTLDLFPQHPSHFDADAPAEEKSQLTIFYGGKMLVFNDFLADKANDLLSMAGKFSSEHPPTSISGTTGLPMKRRASLHRFMEKRRERINSTKKPYQIGESRTNTPLEKPVSGHPFCPELTARIKLADLR